MKSSCLLLICCLFFYTLAWTSADTPKSRSDSHAPIGVMGDHGHKTGEVMLSYRFMAMDMQGLQSGTTTVETAEVLKDFMMAPTTMQMQMHSFGTMFAPHDNLTLMAMANYQFLRMEMEGTHLHKEGHHGPLLDIMKCQVRALVMPNLRGCSHSGKNGTSHFLETSAFHFPPVLFQKMERMKTLFPTRCNSGVVLLKSA